MRMSALLLLAAAIPAFAAEPLRMQAPVPLAESADLDPEMLGDCPIQQYFADSMRRELKSGIELVPGNVSTARGRVLKLEIVDAMWAGNWFIGHQQYVHARGTLYEDGRKVGSFRNRRIVRGGEFMSGCFNVRSTLNAMAWDIKKWLRDPQDGANIGSVR